MFKNKHNVIYKIISFGVLFGADYIFCQKLIGFVYNALNRRVIGGYTDFFVYIKIVIIYDMVLYL